ncbi:MAG TPA: flagellar hook-basal body complex protein [Paucimonas sp.]|nr:flagellar hook-basal body complex protein [Paucimonas sp.]
MSGNEASAIAAMGMLMQQRQLDAISNNFANLSTNGYKADRVYFQDLVRQEMGRASVAGQDETAMLSRGSGVGIGAFSKVFTPGELKETKSAFDVAIRGAGFMEVTLPDGTSAYSRGGQLRITPDGLLAAADGSPLKPAIHVGLDAKDIVIKADGTVSVKNGTQASPVEVGRIDLANFNDPTGLVALGKNLYQPSILSGDPVFGKPAEDGFGALAQGFVETSNVDMTTEMLQLMVAQQAYTMNLKAFTVADRLKQMSTEMVQTR